MHAATLLKYFMAEGVAAQQQLLHLHSGTGGARGLLAHLPRLLGHANSASATEKADKSSLPTAKAEPEKPELKIAWQYKRCAAFALHLCALSSTACVSTAAMTPAHPNQVAHE